MRSLVVTATPIWPIRSGHAVRRCLIVDALARRGSVTVVHVPMRPCEPTNDPDTPVEVVTLGLSGRRATAARLLREAAIDRLPSELVGYGWRQAADMVDAELADRALDLCWLDRPVALLAAERLLRRPGLASICDLDDLEHHKIEGRAVVATDRSRLIDRLKRAQRVGAWRRLYRLTARKSDAVVVCTDEDAARLLPDRAHVVPNCFPDPSPRAAGGPEGATVVLVGLHTYGPNADGALWFARAVLPHLRKAVPDVRVEIVGEAGATLQALAGPTVTVTGAVPDTAPAYARASLLAVPIRFGSGSRIKILEAWARAVPVVSTSLGAAGLGATDGTELLLADTPTAFADACARLILQPGLAADVAARGRARYVEHHTPAVLDHAVGRVVEAALSASSARR